MSNLTKRVLSALLLLPPVVFAFVEGGLWLKGLALVVCAICMWEYTFVVEKAHPRHAAFAAVLGVAAFVLALVVKQPTHALLVVQFALLLLASAYVLAPGDMSTAWRRLSMLHFGLVYVPMGLFSVVALRDMGDTLSGAAQGVYLLVAVTATWANDSAAYFAGRAFGKHKMAEQISPKKTWEGFAGGMVGSAAVLALSKALFPSVFSIITPVDILCIAIPASFLGPMGDLAESMWKRNFDVKDSSNILPGHGGMLDRIDAVLFVAPYVLLYLTVLKPLMPSLS